MHLHGETKRYIGVDIGGTNISAALVDEETVVMGMNSVKTEKERPYKEVLKDIEKLIAEVINQVGKASVKAIGVGCPGICNPHSGVVEYSNNLNWHNAPLKKDIQNKFNIPVYIDNDANAAAYGEFVGGAAQGADSAVIITLGTGVGSGIIIDKKIFRGENCAGGEIGHTVIEVGGEPCTCGRKGCFEAYCSVSGLIRMTKEAIAKFPASSMRELVEKDGKISARTAWSAAKLGDKTGKDIVERYITYLAAGIANTVNIFQPDVVCIGGGICNEGDSLLLPLREKVSGQVFSRDGLKQTRLEICSLGNRAGILGAAMLYRIND